MGGESNFTKGIVGSSYLYNKIVFKKVQALLGGRLKLSGTGSAPLAPKVQMFVQAAFNVPVRQGYGLTETCAASCVQLGCDSSSGVVGPPCPSTCIKLRDWPEGNSLNADKNDPSIGMPRGEVLIGGPTVCQGYYVDKKKPDADVVKKNEEDFSVDADGTRWFHTGDIGQFTPDGCLQIIDRKKTSSSSSRASTLRSPRWSRRSSHARSSSCPSATRDPQSRTVSRSSALTPSRSRSSPSLSA